jgi:hypothetical protein
MGLAMKYVRSCVFALAAALLSLPILYSQTLTSGDLTGTVTDQTGGVVANANVTLKNNGTGGTQTTQTNSDGNFRFSFVNPGSYTVSVNQAGFQAAQKTTHVEVGQAAVVNFQLALASSTTTMQVTEASVAVQTDNANITTNVNIEQIQNIPNGGNDLTYYAQTAPGVTMSTNGGYGNFEAFGLPATSNVFTINGQVNNDVFLNLNNSGSSNLMLGYNEIQEAAVVNNGYTGQYGTLAGTQMNLVSKSGTNQFHGNAVYFWNGSAFNTNNFFNNATDTPKPFSNVNEWAASFGGPIQKDKTFFFVDYEGLRIVLPTNALTRIPSPQFANATLANIGAVAPAELPFYQNIFKLYAGAPGAGNVTPVPGGGCGSFTGLGTGVPCADEFRSTAGNRTKEYLWTARVDHTFSEKDRAYVRIQRDNGTQPTYTDPINPIFNAFSPQPEMNGQISENHTFGATAINQFILSGQFYSARFGSSDPAQVFNTFPTTMRFTGTLFYGLGNESYLFPQGRNVTQYQIIDDFSKTLGKHNFKAGLNFHRADLTDFSFQEYTQGRLTVPNLATFFNGGGSGLVLTQRFPSAPEQPFAYYNLGAYVQDEWAIGHSFKITPTLRIDHNSNPVCQTNCFANMETPFPALPHNPNIPYNQIITSGLHQAFLSTDAIIWQPRIGFAWSPGQSGKTAIRGGFGLFGDTFPGLVAQSIAFNSPELNAFTVKNGLIQPGVAGSIFNVASQANQAFVNGFKNNGTLASISAADPFFVPPNFTSLPSKYKQARYAEWNFEVQQAIGGNMTLSVNYVGNHGYHEVIQNDAINAYFPGFSGLPSTAPDPRFGTVNYLDTGVYSNYSGMVVSVRRRLSAGFTFQANYTYSHARDFVSNGGYSSFDLNTDPSILVPQDPYNYKLYNYGNADYDVRHYASISYVWDDAVRHIWRGGPNGVFGGWILSGTLFTRSGQPFTVYDSTATTALSGDNYGGTLFSTALQPGFTTCSSKAVDTACLGASQFTAPSATPHAFGNQLRNQYRGPDYFDTDIALSKGFAIPKWEQARFTVGVQIYNLFNHPNFDKPVADVSDPAFGTIINLVSPPTSILGSFAGADASGRIIQIKGQFVF